MLSKFNKIENIGSLGNISLQKINNGDTVIAYSRVHYQIESGGSLVLPNPADNPTQQFKIFANTGSSLKDYTGTVIHTFTEYFVGIVFCYGTTWYVSKSYELPTEQKLVTANIKCNIASPWDEEDLTIDVDGKMASKLQVYGSATWTLANLQDTIDANLNGKLRLVYRLKAGVVPPCEVIIMSDSRAILQKESDTITVIGEPYTGNGGIKQDPLNLPLNTKDTTTIAVYCYDKVLTGGNYKVNHLHLIAVAKDTWVVKANNRLGYNMSWQFASNSGVF